MDTVVRAGVGDASSCGEQRTVFGSVSELSSAHCALCIGSHWKELEFKERK